MIEYIIQTKKLTKKFGNFVAVKDLNLKISKNKIHGFIGPNGAGKTTTIKMLTGAIYPSQGIGLIDKYGIGTKRGRSLIGYAPAESLFYDNMTTIEYLVYIGQIKGLRRRKAINKAYDLIDYFDLNDAINRKPITFSSGMKKKVTVAQALINDPKVLILDEPTANLDPTARIQIIDILRKLISENDLSIFISSHILSELETLVDEVTLIRKGEIVLSGNLNTVKNKFNKGQYTIDTSNNKVFKYYLDKYCHSFINSIEENDKGYVIVNVDNVNKYKLESVVPPILSNYKIRLLKFNQEEISLDEIYKNIYDQKNK
ncbi:ABC transporter ATP-binding protein [Mycoplasmatota bacterium]|nr:ABC transporter ATP-binding protein [Mycoplasmatota bacterium]